MSAHYIQPLQKTALPTRHIVFDTETQLTRRAGALEHRYACGALGELILHASGARMDQPWSVGDPETLWAAIVKTCRKGQRTVAWAHNLSFDLRVSEALRWLPRQGFHLQGVVLERTASWASWTSEEHGSLICCDLYAWLPRSLDDIAREMGVSRETWDDESYQAATLPELVARCAHDVEITRQAIQALLGWLQAEDCGPFRLTGSGQAHACWRKRFEAGKRTFGFLGGATRGIENIAGEHARNHGVWVHGDPELRSLEREAMWTGRCEAWRHGDVDGPLYEYDMNLAYCRIAAAHPLPVRLRGEHGSLTPEQLDRLLDDQLQDHRMTILAEIDVEGLEVPLVPCRLGERMIWPTGDFQTILWEPELRLLRDAGVLFHVKRCWTYDTGPALKPMAEWIIDRLSAADTPAPARLLLKHWARALIGRMALRYRRWDSYGEMPNLGLDLWVGYDELGAPVENLQIGHERFTLGELEETETSVPQITGWVMSQCRANLWREIEHVGPRHVVYMDTDSLLTDRTISISGAPRISEHDREMLLKATWDHATIHGPRNIELDQERRLSGIPRRSTRTGPLDYEATVMRGIKESLIRSELDHVAELPRVYHVQSMDPRRERRPDGSTRPYRLGGEVG